MGRFARPKDDRVNPIEYCAECSYIDRFHHISVHVRAVFGTFNVESGRVRTPS
jgi:hypothetical protein